VLVGWSYGGLVITDYLRRHGTADVAGLALVGAITEIGRGHPAAGRAGHAGALPAALSEDPDVAGPALGAFVTACRRPGTPSGCWRNPCGTRLRAAALFDRDVASADVLAAVDVPTLIVPAGRTPS